MSPEHVHWRMALASLSMSILPLALTACSTQAGVGNESAGEPALGQVQSVSATSQIVLPLDQFEDDVADSKLSLQATQILAARCSDRFGVKSTDHSTSDLAPAGPNRSRYGIVDSAVAARFGYHPSDETGRAAAKGNDKNSPDAWNPSPKEVVVMRGTKADGGPLSRDEVPKDANGESLPQGGCSSWANRELTGGKQIDFDLINQWGAEAGKAAEPDSRVRAAKDAWSGCMKASGYDYKSPWDPNDSFASAPTASAKEIATAEADVKCRQETNLVGIWMAVETAYENRAISANEGQFRELQQLLRQGRDTAHRVVAESAHR